jgi:DNA topoisomerase-3
LVINATDFDREGELIFYYLKIASGYNGPCQRAHFQSQTQEEFTKAFAHLKSAADVKNITDAGRARSIADMDIGANMTVCMSLKYPNSGVLSVGRVQTPTLNLLVERELAIRNFVPKPYFTITAKFTTATNESFDASHQKKSFEKKEEAEDVFRKINGKEGTIEKIEKQLVNRPTPNLYNQSSLQMEANNRFGFTMAKTLQLAQELYEAGLTTYPRTDSQYLTENMRPVVTKTLGLMEKNPDYVNYIQGRPRSAATLLLSRQGSFQKD